MVAQIIQNLFIFLLCIAEPTGLFIITSFFLLRFIRFRSLLLDLLFLNQTLTNNKYVFFFILCIVFLMTIISIWPFLLMYYDFKKYVKLYFLFLDKTVYSLFLEDIVLFFAVCGFLFLLDKNSKLIKKEFKEFLITLNKYIYPYFKRKYKSFLTFVSKVLVPRFLAQFILFKNNVRNISIVNDYINLYNFYLRKYKTWSKSKNKK
jgi:hypothetical protein